MSNYQRTAQEYLQGITQEGIDQGCSLILHNILNVYQEAEEGEIVSEQLTGILPNHIDQYIMNLRYAQDLPISNLKILKSTLTDIKILSQIYDYLQSYPISNEGSFEQKIYFIEGSDSAIVVIPVLNDDKEITLHLELLHSSPQFIKDIWDKESTPTSISNIHLKNPGNLKPKRPKY